MSQENGEDGKVKELDEIRHDTLIPNLREMDYNTIINVYDEKGVRNPLPIRFSIYELAGGELAYSIPDEKNIPPTEFYGEFGSLEIFAQKHPVIKHIELANASPKYILRGDKKEGYVRTKSATPNDMGRILYYTSPREVRASPRNTYAALVSENPSLVNRMLKAVQQGK